MTGNDLYLELLGCCDYKAHWEPAMVMYQQEYLRHQLIVDLRVDAEGWVEQSAYLAVLAADIVMALKRTSIIAALVHSADEHTLERMRNDGQ